MTTSAAEVARLFRATSQIGANVAAETYPGYPGLVAADGELRR